MRKVLFIITVFALSLVLASSVWAASLSVRIEEPKSPTNQTGYNINFVALDIQNRVVTVNCLVQKPGEGSFSSFATDVVLPAGGGSGNCSTSGIFSSEGNYNFKVVAQAEAETAEDTTSVTYNLSGPGTPTSYGKDKISSCQYKINFHTANDAGKTVKVEIYRSDNLSFSADSGTRVGTVAIGSNADGSFTDTVGDCNKTYYYAIRAFDSSGNGSGVIGDSTVTIVPATPTPGTTAGQGAIPVSGGTGGAILGEATAQPEASPEVSPEGTPLGEVEAATEAVGQPSGLGGLLTPRNLGLLVLLLAVAAALWYYLRRESSA